MHEVQTDKFDPVEFEQPQAGTKGEAQGWVK
jgi:hypothetical protein